MRRKAAIFRIGLRNSRRSVDLVRGPMRREKGEHEKKKKKSDKRRRLGEERTKRPGWNRDKHPTACIIAMRQPTTCDCVAKALQWRCTNKARYVPWMRPAGDRENAPRHVSPRGMSRFARQKNKATLENLSAVSYILEWSHYTKEEAEKWEKEKGWKSIIITRKIKTKMSFRRQGINYEENKNSDFINKDSEKSKLVSKFKKYGFAMRGKIGRSYERRSLRRLLRER